jgi:hypothetical protein
MTIPPPSSGLLPEPSPSPVFAAPCEPRIRGRSQATKDPSSLYRLSRRLCGTPLPDLLNEAGIPDVVELLLGDIVA